MDLTAYVPSFPKEGGEVEVQRLLLSPGGSAANTAVALRRLGVGSCLIGCIGKDVFGELLQEDLRREGVATSGVQQTSHALTGLVFVLVSKRGERTMHAARGANRHLRFSSELAQITRSGRVFHLSGHAFLDPPQSTAALKLLDEVPKGEVVSLDVGLMAASRGLDFLRRISGRVDFIFLSEAEERLLFRGAHDGARELLGLARKAVVVRRGPKGCAIWHEEKVVRVPALPVTALDTTGGGDAFDAGFLFGVVKKWGLRECAAFGNAVAALKIRRRGTRAGLPSYEQVSSFIRDRGGEGFNA